MDEAELRRLLHSIGSQIRDIDLQNIKYLCSDKVEAGQLQQTESAMDLFILLLNRDIIGTSNLVFLEDVLDKSGRKDLVSRIKSSGRDMASEGPVISSESTTSGSRQDNIKYRVFLNQLCDELTRQNIESLKFLVSVPAAIGQGMKSGHQLFDYLEKRGIIGQSDLSFLAENFTFIHRKDLSKKVEEFSKRQSDPSPVPPISRLTISDRERNTPEPTGAQEHSEHTGALPIRPAPLLTPQYFTRTIINLPPNAPPIIPIESRPRFPVQCGDDIPPLDQEDDMPSYDMRHRPRGYALIISNEKFSGIRNLQDRIGTEKDVNNLKTLWEKLHFEVVIKRNKTTSEMYEIAREFSAKDHSSFDCFVCCLMSHGIHGGIYGIDSEVLELGQITSQFKGSACPSLLNKPKLFFIQACRGTEFDHGTQADAVRNSEEDAMRHSAEPNEGHFLLGYATPPGYVSWRSTEHGSWYISKLCEVFGKYCDAYDVTSMMVKVNDEVSEAYTKKGYKQCPAPVVTLRKRIYLNNN
ncbi:caspase-8-like [Actinia tenebrosa]|uniref:Caspase-8 n=1 Tax=Actinia tenebrosa TaxID=6105 RepID=A0A6P8I241_ACTTE|nr:caspase-8-like [Actinia tenebrosa]